ncbi:hypothetical protein [Streptomyces sp. NPDC053048]|uniref:hypothetical protein n=1 Tax=Streptomyces sp. NPDC053048 TaxID=3365694 RepID=UPI0037D46AC9
MRHPMHVLGSLALAGAALTVLLAPQGAQAATGTFVYHAQRDKARHDLTNPVDGRCYPVGDAHGVTGNETDRAAYLYDTPDCRGAASYFPSGFYGQQTFHSVAFIR